MKSKSSKVKRVVIEHITNNKKEYFIITLLFIIGIFLGVLFINYMQEEQKQEISSYFNSFIEKMKSIQNLDKMELLKVSITQNILLGITIWFFGTTVIGIPIVFGVVIYRGFCLGYTISACIYSIGLSKGLSFVIISLILQNILFIPALLAISVSGFKLYKSIIKDKQRENIKNEVLRHTIFSLIMIALLVSSSLIEIFISTTGLKVFVKYF